MVSLSLKWHIINICVCFFFEFVQTQIKSEPTTFENKNSHGIENVVIKQENSAKYDDESEDDIPLVW